MKLSIITVNLNNAQGLQKTIDSVIIQSFTDYEWIVIDGGSVDGSPDLIEKYAALFRYNVSEPDTGVYCAMNKGIIRATGEYCFFLNSGDYFLESNSLTDFFTGEFHDDIVSGNMIVGSDGIISERYKGKSELTFLDVFQSVIKHQATFIKRDLFTRYGWFNESLKIIADYDFFLRTAGFGNIKYRHVDQYITWFDNGGISNRNPDIVRDEKRAVIESHVPRMLIPDLELLIRYRNIKFIDRIFLARILFRILGKTAKIACKRLKK